MDTEQTTEPDSLGILPLELAETGVTQFANRLRADLTHVHPFVKQAVECYLSILEAKGKRIRGSLTACAYEMCGGTNSATAMLAAGAIEGLHAYLLVIDDIADRALTRRGQPTAHIAMETFLREQGAGGDIRRTATDMVIAGALTGQHKAQTVFANLDISLERKTQLMVTINEQLVRTGLGQILDLVSATDTPMTMKDIITVALSKTAHYSFQMPLETGAILAGAPEASLRLLKAFSLHAGIAFQLQDDILGVFGDEQKIGKSIKSDITEGKQTLLIAYAMQAADKTQRDTLEHALSNPDLTDEDLTDFREILVKTGALKKVHDKASDQVELAQRILDSAPDEWPKQNIDYLHTVAAFTIERGN